MALIHCPECKKEISDKAVSCPNCGCPITAPPDDLEHFPRQEKTLLICKPGIDAYILPVLLIIWALYYFITVPILGVIFLIVAILLILSIKSRSLSISTNGIYGEMGILNKVNLSTPLSAVSSVTATSDIFGRSSGYGTIRITCAQGIYIFKYMKNANKFCQIFNQIRGNLDWH